MGSVGDRERLHIKKPPFLNFSDLDEWCREGLGHILGDKKPGGLHICCVRRGLCSLYPQMGRTRWRKDSLRWTRGSAYRLHSSCLFGGCYKTLRPRNLTEGRVYVDLQFQSWQMAEGAQVNDTESLNSQNHLQQLTSSHKATLLSLSKHCHRLGIKRSSAWDYGRLQTTTNSR